MNHGGPILVEGYPGVYVEEVPSGVRTLTAAGTSTLAVVGHFPLGPVGVPVRITSWHEAERRFGAPDHRHVAPAVLRQFFLQGGGEAVVVRVAVDGSAGAAGSAAEPLPGDPDWAARAGKAFNGAAGIGALAAMPSGSFNLLAVPEAGLMADGGLATYAAAAACCRDALAFLLVDHPPGYDRLDRIAEWGISERLGSDLAGRAAACFPRIRVADPAGGTQEIPSRGAIAGLMARIDSTRGVWKAPAGLEASISGAEPTVAITDAQQAPLNVAGINCLRTMPGARTVQWGARTLAGSDRLASEWKYVSVRRTALMIEQTLKAGLGWVVFEPNGESLWAQIRLNVGAFMNGLFRQGAFQGATARDAYLVKCDAATTTQSDLNQGIVNLLVGFAPLKPAEFVFLRLAFAAGRLPE